MSNALNNNKKIEIINEPPADIQMKEMSNKSLNIKIVNPVSIDTQKKDLTNNTNETLNNKMVAPVTTDTEMKDLTNNKIVKSLPIETHNTNKSFKIKIKKNRLKSKVKTLYVILYLYYIYIIFILYLYYIYIIFILYLYYIYYYIYRNISKTIQRSVTKKQREMFIDFQNKCEALKGTDLWLNEKYNNELKTQQTIVEDQFQQCVDVTEWLS